MCGPAAVIAGVASAALSAAGTIQAGMAANAQGKYQQRVANRNAEIASSQANDARLRGQDELKRLYRNTSQALGVQRASMAANGIDIDYGSAALVQADTKMIGQEDASTISENTFREMAGFDAQGANYRSQGIAARANGKAAMTGAIFSAGATVLGAASQYSAMKQGSFGTPKAYGISGSGGIY